MSRWPSAANDTPAALLSSSKLPGLVRYLLEGSIRKARNEARINVHLIDSTTGYQVWADDFVGELKDVFSLQEQTALKIAQALDLKLSAQEQHALTGLVF